MKCLSTASRLARINKSNFDDKSESANTDEEFDYIKEEVSQKFFNDKNAYLSKGPVYCKNHADGKHVIEYVWK